YVYLYFKHQRSTTQIAKKNETMIFHTWNRLVKEHLPFSFNFHLPDAFYKQLFSQLLSTMGKIIFFTHGFNNRILKIKEIQADIKPVKLPLSLKFYFYILASCPYKPILKFYVYHVSGFYISKFMEIFKQKPLV